MAFKLRKGFERSVAVGFDPEFADVGQQKVAPKRRRWRIRRMSVFALLACSGCHTLLTGSPISLWHIERLDHPAIVKEIAGDGLILDGGRWVKIRFMKRLPADDPVFVEVLNRGVEVGSAGEVFGLIDPPRV